MSDRRGQDQFVNFVKTVEHSTRMLEFEGKRNDEIKTSQDNFVDVKNSYVEVYGARQSQRHKHGYLHVFDETPDAPNCYNNN
jgi:hypothetical protein